jgi:hypothetical protein
MRGVCDPSVKTGHWETEKAGYRRRKTSESASQKTYKKRESHLQILRYGKAVGFIGIDKRLWQTNVTALSFVLPNL